MARTLTPKDAYALMNALVAQATGEEIAEINATNFVSIGERVLASGYENTLNALSLVLGKTLVAVRPYKAKFASINAINTGAYSHRLRKISYYGRNALPTGAWNTDLNTANHAQGQTNAQDTTNGHTATKSMWLQNKPQALERNFGGSSVWQTSTTIYRDALKMAFRSESDFITFINGIMTEKANDIESEKEAFSRLTVLHEIGMIADSGMPEQYVNLTAAYNAKFGTDYTSAQLRSTYLESFLKFFIAEFRKYSDFMTERSIAYHNPMQITVKNAETGADETLSILRHTPKDKQKALLFAPLFRDAEAQVMPEIFNTDYLKIENYEPISFWQSNASEEDRAKVDIVPAAIDNTGKQANGDEVSIPYVVGLLYDEDAMMVDFQLDSADTTPLEARKHYYNIWWSMSRNAINDPTENAILFVMEDPVTP